jgi:hypothetical protein
MYIFWNIVIFLIVETFLNLTNNQELAQQEVARREQWEAQHVNSWKTVNANAKKKVNMSSVGGPSPYYREVRVNSL